MTPLTPRQQQVMRELCVGGSEIDIARRLCCAPRQVRSVRRSVFRKLGVQSRSELVLKASTYIEKIVDVQG